MPTTWTIAIDWARNGFGEAGADLTLEDVTSYVIEANWFLGMRKAYQEIAADSILRLKLKNDDRRFSPEYSSSPLHAYLKPFRPVRVQSHDGTTTRTHWSGWIESIKPRVNQYGERMVEIVAAGAMLFLEAAEHNMAIQENARTSDIVAQLISAVVAPPAVRVWTVGLSRLGDDTWLSNASEYSALDEGVRILTLAADNWIKPGSDPDEADTFSVYRAIQDVVSAERGRFFFDRLGKAIFWNRHHLLYPHSSAATFDDTMVDLDYAFAGLSEFKNEIRVTCRPRTISEEANIVLWQLIEPVAVPMSNGAYGGPNDRLVIRVKYDDGSGNRISARNVSAHEVVFTGSQHGVLTLNAKATSAEIIITREQGPMGGEDQIILSHCVLKGQVISDSGRLEALARDELSIAQYGRRVMNVNIPAMSSFVDAQNVAKFELLRRKDPYGRARSLSVVSHGKNGGDHHAQQLALTIGDLITVQETQTNHEDNYYIIGEAHRLSQGATLYETTWYLEPKARNAATPPTTTWWVLGESHLGTETYIAY